MAHDSMRFEGAPVLSHTGCFTALERREFVRSCRNMFPFCARKRQGERQGQSFQQRKRQSHLAKGQTWDT